MDEGENVIKIRVTAEDPAVKRIYTLTVTRHEMERVSRIAITGVANTEATAEITTINPIPEMQTVYVRYREDGSASDPWQPTQPLTEDTSTTNVSTTLGGLTPGTQYELQASLDSGLRPGRREVAHLLDARGRGARRFQCHPRDERAAR